jgi:hypothetical protein
LTRTPLAAHSTAAVSVKLTIPARAAPLCAMPGIEPQLSATMLTMAPPCSCIACTKHSRAIRKPPVRLVATTASQPLALIVAAGAMYWPPALLTSASMRPWRASTVATACLTASSSRMSQARLSARPPSARISSAVACSLAASRPSSTGVAPSAASSWAVQRPMPEPPPVTTTTWPANRPGANTER